MAKFPVIPFGGFCSSPVQNSFYYELFVDCHIYSGDLTRLLPSAALVKANCAILLCKSIGRVLICLLPGKTRLQMTYYVWSGTLNPTHSLTHSAFL